ncbi:MAG: pyrophosphohydrolase containing a Zn-finger, nucleic-acid-binding [Firmicutes bacterium]|nr:pyrophosphohydrolase containing a Zn-finger, nucleic-acid-binding [Bacillota bacterium]
MIQDIEPKIFNNNFKHQKAKVSDLFLSYQGDTVLIKEDKDKLWYPSFADFQEKYPSLIESAQFLFTINEINYYLTDEQGLDSVEGWIYVNVRRFRSEPKYWRSFAGAVGWQLNRWYADHKFCSRCQTPLKKSDKERMLYCDSCNLQIHPKISPAIIVGVYDKNRLLLTKYAGREHVRHALIAGFVEIGESLEQTVHREVLEEAGLKVKNLKFYKSQPWPFTDTLLAGFFAELDGDDAITLETDELALGVWVERENIPLEDELQMSLTSEMIAAFKKNTMNL